ncbi:prepilin-type N-terminal cleavage/methylation domain-containing protein [Sulfurimonas sp.]|nr:prepilin-type N-terminal cleavage/methylation domain-containing protein [Sulfurimonas sp.]
MIQGSNMTRGHKGMRKGISLLEMLMAIVLLGLLGTISYNYYKIYYDVAFAAKQAKIYVIMDQAVQISGAHDLYTVKNGVVPTTMAELVADRQLLKIPDPIPEITGTGWVIQDQVEIDGGTTAANDIYFQYEIDGTAAQIDKLEYCNILTNTFDNTWSLDVTVSDDTAVTGLGADVQAAYASQSFNGFCFATGGVADTYELAFIKTLNPL